MELPVRYRPQLSMQECLQLEHQKMPRSKHVKLAAMEHQHCGPWECHLRHQMNAGDQRLPMTLRRDVAEGSAPGGSPRDRQRRGARGAHNVRARPGAGSWRPDPNFFFADVPVQEEVDKERVKLVTDHHCTCT